MFGTKRGRCMQNTRCFRYMPGNTKINGCAMKGMGAVTCQRCGFQNIEHEDLGRSELTPTSNQPQATLTRHPRAPP
jgi:hypothetical protein